MSEIQYSIDASVIQHKRDANVLPDGRVIFFGAGRRDNFCTYVGTHVWNPNTFSFDMMCGVLKDDFYFSICKRLTEKYGCDVVYHKHLTGLYNRVTNVIESATVNGVYQLVNVFDEVDRGDAILAYMLIYYGMVAEENYNVAMSGKRPICGKVIKMAGLYKHLIQDVPLGNPQNPGACHCYVGVNPQAILQDAANYGIYRDTVVYRW